jgi:putative ABC transport system permease protein
LTALGTILGVGAFVTTTGLAQTARAEVSSRFDALKATEVRVQDATPDGENPFPDDVDARLSRLNGVQHGGLMYAVADPERLAARSTARRPLTVPAPIPVVAATPGALAAALPTMATGRIFDEFHERRGERVVVLGRVAAEQLGVTRVDQQPAVFLADVPFTVIGILDDVRRQPDLLLSVVVPVTTEQSVVRTRGATYEVLIDTTAGAAALIGRQAPLALRPDQPERLTALVPPDPQTLRNSVESDVTGLYYALAGLALLVGTIAIANATLLNTIERRPEIGLRRALGAKRSHVARQITLEATLTGTLAAVTGAAIAVLAIAVVARARGWTTTIDPVIPLCAPLIGAATGAVAGVVPALRAAATPPAVTLRG